MGTHLNGKALEGKFDRVEIETFTYLHTGET
jgi:hypothetical protein